MIVKSLEIKNKQIHLENINIDFSKVGIYVISGINGSGKTSLIEKIIFDGNDATFSCNEQERLFKKSKYNVITYISQRIISTSTSVEKYVRKGNKAIDNGLLINLLNQFGLDSNLLKQNFKTLSGGEKEKIAIICGLLKATPYLFIDEPTNNLDDHSVIQFINIIEEIAKSTTVVIITHDPRLIFSKSATISIQEGIVTSDSANHSNITNYSNQNKINCNFLKISLDLFKNATNFFTVISMLVIIILLSIYTQIQFERDYSMDTVPPSNVIISYKADYVYGDLNKAYVEEEHISINEDDKYSMLGYDDLPLVMTIDGVESVLVEDYEYIDRLNTKLQEHTLTDTMEFISVPKIIADSFDERIMTPYKLSYLVAGEFPNDNANEVAISKDLLIKYFGFTEANVNEAIGNNIEMNNKTYTVVGLYYFDLCILSYEKNINYGFYEYEQSTFDSFREKNLSYKTSIDGIYPEKTNEVIILTKEGKEKLVLKYLFEKYPADNYYSHEYVLSWVKSFNSKFIKKITLINIVFSVIIGIILLMLNKNNYSLIKQKIYDYENYYIDRIKFKAFFLIASLIQCLFVLIISIVTNIIINSFSYVTNQIVAIDISIILFFIIALAFFEVFCDRKVKVAEK